MNKFKPFISYDYNKIKGSMQGNIVLLYLSI